MIFDIIVLTLVLLFLIASITFIVRQLILRRRAKLCFSTIDTVHVNKWEESFLDKKRMMSDDLADKAVEAIMARNDLNRVNDLFNVFTKGGQKLGDDAPPELKQYFEETGKMPEWVDRRLIDLGQQIYIRHGVWISLMLSYKSLPECYACANGAQVLYRTGRLNEKMGSTSVFSRRIAETAQFIMFVMTPGGLDADNRGIVAIQKLRLIHGVIRYYLRKSNWGTEKYGEPINQEDLAGTLMAFSALVNEGLEKMDIKLEPIELEAYIYCWRVIGILLGIDADLIPANAADALKLGYRIMDHQKAKSEQGSILMKALLEYQDALPNPIIGEQNNISMFRFMMGDEMSELLDVPQDDKPTTDKMINRLKRITGVMEFLDKSMILAMILQLLNKIGIRYVIRRMTKSDIVHFFLPTGLKTDRENISPNENPIA